MSDGVLSAEGPGVPTRAVEEGASGEKGLKKDAIGFLSGVVIGVASTAPGYSLAAVLGFVAIEVGFQSPAIMLVAFIPMLFTAAAFYYLNRIDPDCGITFAWATKAFGPVIGWMGGWAIVVADIVVMANLAAIAGQYSFLLVGADSAAADTNAVLVVGVLWIILMTLITYVGIELSARTQWFLLAAEIVALLVFSIVALVRVGVQDIPGEVTPSLDWINPFAIDSSSAFAAGLLLAIFIYWGWDSTVSVNEESENANEGPGKAAVVSTIVLLAIYVSVSIAALAYHGVDFLSADENVADVLGALAHDVLGSPLDKVLIIAVLTSAAASTQTTILPTTRAVLSMAAKGAAPKYFRRIHPRYLTPSTATVWMGILSVVWYVGLTIVSENILFDSLASLGLMIAFYYGLTAIACVVYFRRLLLKSARHFILVGLVPLAGAAILFWAFVKSIIDLSDPANSESGESWFGLGPPLVIAASFLVLGIILMLLQWRAEPGFFRRKIEVAAPDALDPQPEAEPA
jgi:amino acid transporter